MKTLLCAVNSKFIHSNPAVYSLKAACEKYGDLYGGYTGTVNVREFSINDSYESILHSVLLEEMDILALSVYIWNIDVVTKLCRDVRLARPGCTILLGGPEVSFGIAHTALSEKDYDYILQGEGERSFFCLLSVLQNSAFCPPASFAFSLEHGVVRCAPIEDLAELPEFYTEEALCLFKNRILYYESSRGCPYRCAYCLSATCGAVRYLPLPRVYADLDRFISAGVPLVKFTDRTFNCNPVRAKSIIRYILQAYEKSPFQTVFHFEVGADLFDRAFLELLSDLPVGLIQLEAGVQSTNPLALEACVRSMPLDKIFYNLKEILSGANINVHADLIAGLPFEGYESFQTSFDDLYRLRPHQLQLGFLKLLSGAPMNQLSAEHGYVFSDHTPYEIICNKYISVEELLKLKSVEDVLERYYNSGRFTASLPMLEKSFSSPFHLYESLADFYTEKNLIYAGISSVRQYDLLMEFAAAYVSPENMDVFKETLLLDFFRSDKSDIPPNSLRDIWCSERSKRTLSNAILAEKGYCQGEGYRVRFTTAHCYIMDYRSRHPVTGLFGYEECIKQ